MRKILLTTIIMGMSVGLIGCSTQTLQSEESTNTQTSTTVSSENISDSSSKMTVEQAKEIALNHAKLTSKDVSFINEESDIDDGLETYDIEFYSDNKEYDYEISATDGEIIEYDYDVESYSNITDTNSNSNQITIEEAKEIALNHAKLTSKDVSHIEVDTDFDDNTPNYDIEFYHNNTEYNYEIDANSGNIISFENDTN